MQVSLYESILEENSTVFMLYLEYVCKLKS